MDGSRPDDFARSPGPVKVRVVRTLDDFQKIVALRALIYMAEQDCPYDEEFDGNDLAGATHLLAEIGGEPVGCMRVRWFCDFAKVERSCVRPDFRSFRIGWVMMDHAIDLIRRKGYRKVLGHAQEHLVGYWERYGLLPRKGRDPFAFSDRAYREVLGIFPQREDALHLDVDPLVLDRPEGAWDRPGPLDRSAARGAKSAMLAAAKSDKPLSGAAGAGNTGGRAGRGRRETV